MTFLKNVLIAIDQLANALLGGWPDETLSSRAYRWSASGKRHWPMRLIDALFRPFEGKGHCQTAYENELLGNHRPRAMRMDAP